MAGDKHERGPYSSGLARREAILDAAVDLLADVGYHGMSLRDVARHVGISHPGVIYHFPSKEVLLMSVVERYEAQIGFDMEELEKLDAAPVFDSILTVLANIGNNPMLIEVECMLLVEASSDVHPAHDHYEQRNLRLREVLKRAWSRLQTEGKAVSSEDPLVLANIGMSLYDGIMNQWLYDRELNAAGQMAHFYLSQFLPEFREEMLLHYRENGWV